MKNVKNLKWENTVQQNLKLAEKQRKMSECQKTETNDNQQSQKFKEVEISI